MSKIQKIIELVDPKADIDPDDMDLDFVIESEDVMSDLEGWVFDGQDRILAIAAVPEKPEQTIVLFADEKMKPDNAVVIGQRFNDVKSELTAKGLDFVRLPERGATIAVRNGYNLDELDKK